jgi:hypothetical protein
MCALSFGSYAGTIRTGWWQHTGVAFFTDDLQHFCDCSFIGLLSQAVETQDDPGFRRQAQVSLTSALDTRLNNLKGAREGLEGEMRILGRRGCHRRVARRVVRAD